MVITKRRARIICNSLIKRRYPGHVLIMDRIFPKAYISLWGQGKDRVEIAFSRIIEDDRVKANVATYKIE